MARSTAKWNTLYNVRKYHKETHCFIQLIDTHKNKKKIKLPKLTTCLALASGRARVSVFVTVPQPIVTCTQG